MESFDEQWAEVAAMTEKGPFISTKPVICTSGSMSTVKAGFFMQYGISFICVLLGLMTLIAVVYNLSKEPDHGDLVTFLSLLLGALFVFFGVIRILSIRRICWNENAESLYVHYGWLWNRHIFQIPRGSVHIKMAMAGETKWFSPFCHGDTILSLELKNRGSASPIRLLANSSRESIGRIAERLSARRGGVDDSTLAREITSDGRTICFPMTAIGDTGWKLPTTKLIHRPKQGQIIIGRFAGFGIAKVIIDSQMSAVVDRRSLSKCVLIMFEDVAGIQVCPRHAEDGEGGYTAFELNLVFQSDLDIKRFNFMADGDNEKIMSYAQQIASAMNKPVFDHSMIKKKTLDDTIIL